MARNSNNKELTTNRGARVDGELNVEGPITIEGATQDDDLVLSNNAGSLEVNGSAIGGGGAVVGAKLFLSANSNSVGTYNQDIPYDSTAYDTDGFVDPDNDGFFIIPAGLGGLYRIECNVEYLTNSAADIQNQGYLRIVRGVTEYAPSSDTQYTNNTTNVASFNLTSEIVLEEGDTVSVKLYSPADTSVQVSGQAGADSWTNAFSLRRIGDAPITP